jgi:hypothetical protein
MSEWNDGAHDDLARELRQGAGAEMRAEAEIVEQETHLGRLRKRSLADVARDAMHRGDAAIVEIGGRVLRGHLAHAGVDYIVIETDEHAVDVRLVAVAIRFDPSPQGGHSSPGGSRTLRARLSEYEQTGEELTVVAPGIGVEVSGAIAVAASDHLVVRRSDQTSVHVPTGAVALVIRPRSRR